MTMMMQLRNRGPLRLTGSPLDLSYEICSGNINLWKNKTFIVNSILQIPLCKSPTEYVPKQLVCRTNHQEKVQLLMTSKQIQMWQEAFLYSLSAVPHL